MPEKLIIIIGAGGHGRVVLDIVRAAGAFTPAGFIDADATRHGQSEDGLVILGGVNVLPRLGKQGIAAAIVAIGDNRVRVSYAELVRQGGLKWVNAVHPRATISPTARLGTNLCIAAGAVVGPAVVIEDSVIINTAAVADHECHVHVGVHIAPGAILAGRVTVEAGAFIGMGAGILPCLRIGAGATVGAGAVVIEDVPPGVTVAGVPARVLGR